MNKEQALERLTALEDEAKKLREILEAPENKERWRAKHEETYFYVDECAGAREVQEVGNGWGQDRYYSFNYFQTKEEAERIARVQLAYRKLDWAIRQFDVTETEGFQFHINGTFELAYMCISGSLNCLPKVLVRQDAEYILSNYKSELLTFLTGGEK